MLGSSSGDGDAAAESVPDERASGLLEPSGALDGVGCAVEEAAAGVAAAEEEEGAAAAPPSISTS